MPDPDPPPAQPRPISAMRWLLMLTPALLAIGAPLIGESMRCLRLYKFRGLDATPELVILMVAALLCFFLGFRLEKWRSGDCRDWLAALGSAFLIFFLNLMISL